MCKLLHDPIVWVAAWYVFSSAVYGMPAPGEKSGTAYRWIYRSAHLLAANWDRVRLNRP